MLSRYIARARLCSRITRKCERNLSACASHVRAQSSAHFDAILVLGGGLLDNGDVPPWVASRLEVAVALQQQSTFDSKILCLGGGTPHKPSIIGRTGQVVHEASSCAKYLLSRDVPASCILKETSSYDTVGNAYYSLVIHAIPADWQNIAVVTSAFHMPRTIALFEHMYGLAQSQRLTETSPLITPRFQLTFVQAEDDNIFTPEVLAARAAKEASSLSSWNVAKENLNSIKELHAWLHTTHICYAVQRQEELEALVPSLDKVLLASY